MFDITKLKTSGCVKGRNRVGSSKEEHVCKSAQSSGWKKITQDKKYEVLAAVTQMFVILYFSILLFYFD